MKTYLQSALQSCGDMLFYGRKMSNLEELLHLVPGEREKCKLKLASMYVDPYGSWISWCGKECIKLVVDDFFDQYEKSGQKMTVAHFKTCWNFWSAYKAWSEIVDDPNTQVDKKDLDRMDAIFSRLMPDIKEPIRKRKGVINTFCENICIFDSQMHRNLRELTVCHKYRHHLHCEQAYVLEKLLQPPKSWKDF